MVQGCRVLLRSNTLHTVAGTTLAGAVQELPTPATAMAGFRMAPLTRESAGTEHSTDASLGRGLLVGLGTAIDRNKSHRIWLLCCLTACFADNLQPTCRSPRSPAHMGLGWAACNPGDPQADSVCSMPCPACEWAHDAVVNVPARFALC